MVERTVEIMKSEVMVELNEGNEREVKQKIKDSINNIIRGQRIIRNEQGNIKKHQEFLKSIEAPEQVTSEILG